MAEEENKANGRSEGEHRGEEEERKETEIIKQKEDGISLSLSSSSTMKPWEQHAGVIVMPRFDYNAPSSLLQYSRSGFLITCPISLLLFLLNPRFVILFPFQFIIGFAFN